jgi:hypothetical protein
MNDIIVIDDFVSKQDQDIIENRMLDSFFPWYYNNTTYSVSVKPKDQPKSKYSVDTFQFIHNFFNNNEFSSKFDVVTKIIESFPYTNYQLMRVKGNITTANPLVSSKSYGVPHTDYYNTTDKKKLFKNFITCIYYVNNSDGDTVIFNEKNDHTDMTNFTEKQRVSPKKGRIILFDGNYYHSGNNPSGPNPRIVVNINLLLDINSEIGYN